MHKGLTTNKVLPSPARPSFGSCQCRTTAELRLGGLGTLPDRCRGCDPLLGAPLPPGMLGEPQIPPAGADLRAKRRGPPDLPAAVPQSAEKSLAASRPGHLPHSDRFARATGAF